MGCSSEKPWDVKKGNGGGHGCPSLRSAAREKTQQTSSFATFCTSSCSTNRFCANISLEHSCITVLSCEKTQCQHVLFRVGIKETGHESKHCDKTWAGRAYNGVRPISNVACFWFAVV